MADHRLSMKVQAGGISGTVHFARSIVRDWRSVEEVDVGQWWGYYTAMLNRGVIPMATGADEQWTTSVAHTQADSARQSDSFEEVVERMKPKATATSLV